MTCKAPRWNSGYTSVHHACCAIHRKESGADMLIVIAMHLFEREALGLFCTSAIEELL
ncbi:hypothetical protein SLEP1_g59335 [Rubroshorea leprosula]|uniref:Uncharacterized protein n=1 Tax=Rubroshorea leprosula TaxID=152421 RepID=A0AAV5MUU6_9ROSI|nr:hypothetical protein SLEP1_g59335 [Rubroshorea leprosula]